MPVTFPEPSTVATSGLLLVHTPPVVVEDRVVVVVRQIVEEPEIAEMTGISRTLTVRKRLNEPQLLVNV
jgi:hypothetical protein